MMSIKMLEIAIQIAVKYHSGQTDRAGKPYILHCLRVMFSGETIQEKIVGVLHDIVEDTLITFNDLINAGFLKKIVEAIDCLTKRPGEKYQDYLNRIKTNPTAIKVKLNDLKDNLDVTRLKQIDTEKINKYLKAYQFLKHEK